MSVTLIVYVIVVPILLEDINNRVLEWNVEGQVNSFEAFDDVLISSVLLFLAIR